MPAPVYSDYTQKVYEGLPQFLREQDTRNGYALLRYMSTLLDQGQDASTLLDRFTPDTVGGTSDLTDPATADAAWLRWLAQLVGVKFDQNLATAEHRTVIGTASSGWRAGTRGGIIDAVKTYLSGSQFVSVKPHYTALGVVGGMWDILVLTLRSESSGWSTLEATYPDWAAIEAALDWATIEGNTTLPVDELVAKAGAKPAGIVLHHDYSDTTWGDLHVGSPTWSDWHTLSTWSGIYEA